jgi:hypothetical protein
MTMEDEPAGCSGIINWITKLTRKIASGKIVPMYCGENLPLPVADSVRDARALWIILLRDSTFDIDGLFANCEKRGIASSSPTHSKRRIMFPCPVHNSLDSESQANVIRRSKLARSWGLEVKWADHEVLESTIIINPPTQDNDNFDDGIAFIDLSLPHLDTAAPAKFEITQKHQARIFSDLVKSFTRTWGKAHDPAFEKEKPERTRIVLKGMFVA